jgi:predicted transcriptional regulator of viral defense system
VYFDRVHQIVKAMNYQAFLARHPVFTYKEFEAFLASQRNLSKRTQDSLLTYYTKTGRILRVRRGLFASVPLGVSPENSPVDPHLIAAKLAQDAILAYHTALEFHGKAYSVQQQFVYLTQQASRPLHFRSHSFRAVGPPKALKTGKQRSVGVVVADRLGLDLRVTSLERTLVDVLDRPGLGGGWEEIWRSLESVEFFDLDQVVKYALLLGNATTVAKVGLYLEQHREALMVTDSHLKRLRAHRPAKAHYLDRGRRESGRFVENWNLVVPQTVLERSWQEVR